MKAKQHLDSLFDVWEKLPQSEKAQYSTFAYISETRCNKENIPEKRPQMTTHKIEKYFTLNLDESLTFTEDFGRISEISFQSLPVTPRHLYKLYVSDFQAANDLGLLRKNRIFSILTLGKKNRPLKYPAIKGGYRCVDFRHDAKSDIIKYLAEICCFLKEQIVKGNVLVHCLSGKNRACAAAIGFLMKQFSISFEEAHKIVNFSCNSIEISENYLKQLSSYRWKGFCI